MNEVILSTGELVARQLLTLGGASAFLSLPFWPAIREALRPSDESPLEISKHQLSDPRGDTRQVVWRYCSMFGEENPAALRARFERAAALPSHEIAPGAFAFAAGALVPEDFGGTDALSAGKLGAGAGRKIAARLFSFEDVEIGAGAEVLEAHAEREVRIGREARIAWWCSAARIRLGEEARAIGSLVARESVDLAAGSTFHVVRAPVVVATGQSSGEQAELDRRSAGGTDSPKLAPVPDSIRRVVDGDLSLGADTQVDENLIVRGDVWVGEGTRVAGSIKARGTIRLARGAHVAGSCVAERGVDVGPQAQVAGCVLGERWVRLGAGSVSGRSGASVTVCGQDVELAPGARVHGLIRAWKRGSVTQ